MQIQCASPHAYTMRTRWTRCSKRCSRRCSSAATRPRHRGCKKSTFCHYSSHFCNSTQCKQGLGATEGGGLSRGRGGGVRPAGPARRAQTCRAQRARRSLLPILRQGLSTRQGSRARFEACLKRVPSTRLTREKGPRGTGKHTWQRQTHLPLAPAARSSRGRGERKPWQHPSTCSRLPSRSLRLPIPASRTAQDEKQGEPSTVEPTRAATHWPRSAQHMPASALLQRACKTSGADYRPQTASAPAA